MCDHCMNRREFTALTTAGLAGSLVGLSSAAEGGTATVEPWDPDKPLVMTGRPLRVQPILAHAVQLPREKTSWRSWSEITNEPAAIEEIQRITGELKALSAKADFPLECLPPVRVTAPEQATNLQQGDWKRLIPEARDSHWMMVYGDYLREAGYAARKIGLTWDNISDADA
jgi:hypothetical protein